MSLFVEEDEHMHDAEAEAGVEATGTNGHGDDHGEAASGADGADGADSFASASASASDPIVELIPLVLSRLPAAEQSLHILQFPGRPKRRPYSAATVAPAIKPESAVLQLTVPLDTLKFYDPVRFEDWGVPEQIQTHALEGVLNETEGGMYVARNVGGCIVLLPVDRTAQLRPSFKYLDDVEQARQAQRRSDYMDAQKPSSIQVLQTLLARLAAAQGNTGEGLLNQAMGESLRRIRKFDEEDWVPLHYEASDRARDMAHALSQPPQHVLHTDMVMADYIDELMR